MPGTEWDEKQPDAALPWIIVLSAGQFDDAFLAGIGQTSVPDADVTVLRISDLGSPDLSCLQAMLTAGRRQTLVGLVDDGLAAIIVESARMAGARGRWLGQHVITAEKTSHRLLTPAGECAARFGEALSACGSRYSISRQNLSVGEATQFSTTFASAPGQDATQWAFALGRMVAMAHGREPMPLGESRPEAIAGRMESGPSRAAESFVSLAFDL
ncbi:hypothetical protein [Microvirga sp. M2]|uniref:hypothetical protein n=1 Tax=Microvirga sp. M2 TaxID=3073270 RepID=UPI0039C272D3